MFWNNPYSDVSHSFGYDCTRRANLQVLESDVVTFIAGNYVVILNVKTKKQVYIRSTGGRGIGAIAVSEVVIPIQRFGFSEYSIFDFLNADVLFSAPLFMPHFVVQSS